MTAPSAPISETTQLVVDVISDVVCPWCFVGKRQLEQALAQFASQYPALPRPMVRWHPFQLNPDLPAQGMPRSAYLQAKFGSNDIDAIYQNVLQAAQAVELTLNLDRIMVQPNTVRAHAIISMAGEETQDAVVEAMFDAYFRRGLDLTEESTLIEIARAQAIPEPSIEAAIHDEAVHETIIAADKSARDLSVEGVPFFIFNHKVAVSGAAGAEALLQAAARVLSVD